MPSTQKIKRNHRRNSLQLFLGIDGGGTKTHALLLDYKGETVGEGISGASNPLRVGIETAVANIFHAAESACDSANRILDDIAAVQCGLAGVRREDLRRTIRQRISESFRIKAVEVLTDAEIALYGVTLGKAGLVIIAGTGSICLGKNDDGATAMAGGWGPLAGDEGGGAGIARRALQAIAKASDGRGDSTKLSKYASEYFRTSTPDDLIVAIYSPKTDNAKIAGFARFVVETAQEGDEIAIDILKEAGSELGLAASAVIKKLRLNRRKIPIGCVGSIFKAGGIFKNSILETVHQTAPNAFLTEPKFYPAHAAARMAFEKFQ
jgi:N-acetylglucosamine kinase-like BadF-type ATPase